jgi:hypothetical protein
VRREWTAFRRRQDARRRNRRQEFKLCSAESAAKLRKDPAPFAAKLDKAIIDSQAKDYPLDRCPTSGKALGSMREPVKLC